MSGKKNPKGLLALLLSLALGLGAVSGMPASAASVDYASGTDCVSRLVTGENGKYIEYKGAPYLAYSMQLRADWYMEDKGRLSAAERAEYGLPEVDYYQNSAAYTPEQKAKYLEIAAKLRDEFIEETFRKVKEDGFNSVNIPIYWSNIEKSAGVYDFSRLQYYYNFLNKYDLTVQWLWFGTNVCGGGALAPTYILNNTDTYKRVYPENYEGTGVWFDFSCAATMAAEQNALAAMMQWLAKNDTERRCVMIQVNNEVDQGADTFEKYAEGGTAKSPYWWNNAAQHDKYCWTGGQRDALFAQLSALGDIVHNSAYNCVTRVNFSGAGRNMAGIADDVTDLAATTGIDMVGEDIYYSDWDNIDGYLQPKSDDNFTHLAECSTTYDYSNIAGKIFSIGGGFMPYCYRDDRIENSGEGMYANIQAARPVRGADESEADYAARVKAYEYNAYWEGRVYRGWTEREGVTDAIRSFNRIINNMYVPLARATAERSVAEFNGEREYRVKDGALCRVSKSGGSYTYAPVSEFTETQSFGGCSITYTSQNDGLGLMLNTGDNEFILTSTKGGTYTFNTDKAVCYQSGVYRDKYWVSDSRTAQIGNTVSVAAGQIVKVWVGTQTPPEQEAPTYGVFGKTEKFALSAADSADGLEVITDSSINSRSGIVKNKSAAAQKIILSESAANFKIALNFKVGAFKNTLKVNMPGSNMFHMGRWQAAQAMAVAEGKEVAADQYSGLNDSNWHRAEITLLGDNIAFLIDGACLYRGTLSAAPKAGELSVTLGNAAAISDLEVTYAAAEDAATVINADYSAAPLSKLGFSQNGVYGKTAGELVLNANMQQRVNFYYYDSNGNWTERVKEYSKVKNYTVEAEFRTEGFSGENTYQRGFALVLPGNTRIEISGSLVRYFKNGVKTGEATHGKNIHDGKYHKVKAVCKEQYIQLFLDDAIIAAYENAAAERENSLVAYELYVDGTLKTEVVAFKSIKITDNTDLEARKAYSVKKRYGYENGDDTSGAVTSWGQVKFVAGNIGGRQAHIWHSWKAGGGNAVFTGRPSADNFAFGMSVYMTDTMFNPTGTEHRMELGFATNFSKCAVKIDVYENQLRLTYPVKNEDGTYKNADKWINYDDNYGAGYAATIPNRRIDIEVIFTDNRIIFVFDGHTHSVAAAPVSAYKASFGDYDYFKFDGGYVSSDGNARCAVANMRFEYIDSLKNAMDAIDSIGTVEPCAESAARIDTAYSAYEDLGKAEQKNVVNSAVLISAASSYKSLSGGADVNFNGSTDLLDLIALKKVTVGINNKNFMCDLNGDGSVTSQDLTILKKLLIMVA